MAKLILFFNHTLTRAQRDAAYHELEVSDIVTPPPPLQNTWADIPPAELEIRPLLEPIFAWLRDHADPGDYILVQGDFGACYLLVDETLKQELVPVYSTTKREAVEEQLTDGSIRVQHRFNHVRYRLYGP